MAALFPNEMLQDWPEPKTSVRGHHDRLVRGVLDLIWRRKWMLASISGIALVAASLLLSQMPAIYTAEAVVQLSTRKTQYLDISSVVSNLNADSLVVRSETDVIRSRTIAGRVVDRLGLAQDPVQEMPKSIGHAFLERIEAMLTWALASWEAGSLLPLAPAAPAPALEGGSVARIAAIDRLLSRLSVTNDGRSYTIRIAYSSTDPAEAARISNAVAEEYVQSQIDSKSQTTRQATEWLASSLESARLRVERATAAVDDFKEENGIGDRADGAPSLPMQQVRETDARISEAEASWSISQARLLRMTAQIGAGQAASLPEVLSSPVIQSMRGSQLELRGMLADLRQQYGDRHPEVRQVLAKLADIDGQIQLEITKIITAESSEADSLKIRLDMLRERRLDLQHAVGLSNRLQTRLRELESEVEASRSLYQAISARYVETSTLQNIAQADAQIVSLSDPPLLPSGPKVVIILLLVGIMSCLIGIALLVLLSRLDTGFRTSSEVGDTVMTPCLGMVPLLTGRHLAGRAMGDTRGMASESAFAEALRSVRTALRMQSLDRPARVFLVTSSLPGEGKTVLTAGLAMAFAESGLRTLMIDADLRRPALGRVVGASSSFSLSSVLDGDVALAAAATPISGSKLHVLTAVAEGARSQDRLGSSAMRSLIESARDQYDIILIDTPPVMLVADAILAASLSDSVIYLAQWERTPRETVAAGLERLRAAGTRISGVILSQVDLGRHVKYGLKDEGYYYLKNRKGYLGRA